MSGGWEGKGEIRIHMQYFNQQKKKKLNIIRVSWEEKFQGSSVRKERQSSLVLIIFQIVSLYWHLEMGQKPGKGTYIPRKAVSNGSEFLPLYFKSTKSIETPFHKYHL